MSYQPPLIGHKTLLNIESYSLPDSGAYVLALSLLLVTVALGWAKLSQVKRARELFGPISKTAVLLLALHVLGCTSKAEPIQAEHEECHACHMTISDPRFGGEVLSAKGKAFKFDSLSCLIRYYKQTLKSDGKARAFVEDYFAPGTQLRAEDAHFLTADGIHAPMGRGILATADVKKLNALKAELKSAEETSWQSLLSKY